VIPAHDLALVRGGIEGEKGGRPKRKEKGVCPSFSYLRGKKEGGEKGRKEGKKAITTPYSTFSTSILVGG